MHVVYAIGGVMSKCTFCAQCQILLVLSNNALSVTEGSTRGGVKIAILHESSVLPIEVTPLSAHSIQHTSSVLGVIYSMYIACSDCHLEFR